MTVAVVLGVLAGALGFLPLWGALVGVKHVTSTSNLSHATLLLLAVLGSMAVLFGAAIACVALSRQSALAFAAGEAGGLIAAAAVLAVRRLRGR